MSNELEQKIQGLSPFARALVAKTSAEFKLTAKASTANYGEAADSLGAGGPSFADYQPQETEHAV